ncbi:C5a peptidase [Quillaja saponaria]|uniref:C5a peptidase n=1 Tax=Quillaja saponaria TaxID=32244 RepID=A0AAD7PWJ1_QUISA|nr:C5a peptidase [Quillaja saponaria]
MDSNVVSHETPSFWTNEKHVDFLNTIEASFVRKMFENQSRFKLRLDRYLPDISESTLDSKYQQQQRQRRKKHTSSDLMGPRGRIIMDRRIDKRTRRVSSQLYNSLNKDQVVPQLENRRDIGSGDVKDEAEQTNVNVPMAPVN